MSPSVAGGKYQAELDGDLLRISGELDYTISQEARAQFRELLAEGVGALKVDIGELQYMDSSGLGVLLDMRKFLASTGRSMIITRFTPHVAKIFEVTQVGKLFGI